MPDRYKDEIEEILEGSPDLPIQSLPQDESIESLKDQLVFLFVDFRNRKIGPVSAFNTLIGSVIFFALFLVTKVNLFAVIGIGCLLVSYLTAISPTSLRRLRLYFDKVLFWFKRLREKPDK